jgi:serine/threonine protein kinase
VSKEQREFRGNPLTLKRLRVQFGLTIEMFCRKAQIDKGTAQKLFRGDAVHLRTISEAAKVFSITNHLELLHPDELLGLGVDPDTSPSPKQVQEWKVEAYLTSWERTANGLQYQVARLRHRLLMDRFARGKCYELRHLAVPERRRLEEHLRRHAEVCTRIGKHPNIAENLDATVLELGGLWWVLDRWEEGQTLEARLKDGPMDLSDLKKIMLGIAEGLHALHKEKIVRRELSPRFILLREKDRSPVLTDFELAKLLEGKRTVRPEGGWPEDPYLALEVTGDSPVDARADIYSWGRVFAHAATGTLPATGEEGAALKHAGISTGLRELVERCVSKSPRNRPGEMTEIVKSMRRWRI